ncbi:hypothetical protein ACQJBY_073717 [Aegilops geniculata]
MIAVKVLNYIPGHDVEQFQKEYHNLVNLQHENIVRLIGYCHETFGEFKPYEGKEIFVETIKRALCFEYMQNGSLDSCIADESTGHDWSTRYAIIKGICQGLKYLHEELVPPMLHLDLKPGNILLDENMVPKIADFGLSRLFGGEQTQMTKTSIGTRGYVPPEYIDAAVITVKFDIFSLGVIIIKIMTGPKGYFRSAEMSPREFIELVHGKWKNKLQTTTPADALEPYCEQVKRCIEIALSCVDADRHKRPTMGVIIEKLNETEPALQSVGASMTKTGSSIYKATDFPRKQGKEEYTSSGTKPTPREPGGMQMAIKNHKKVMLEITGGDYNHHRPGLDLVAVVDVSSSMNGEKMEQLKTAMRFVVQKLTPIDRFCIVTFSDHATRLCPLTPMFKSSQAYLQQLVDDLKARGGTNISNGLLAGLKILDDRRMKNGRIASIMLMSDGAESMGDASQVDIRGNVPVYTFSFGFDSDHVVLSRVAANSNGGTFSQVRDIHGGGLTMAFSQCLAGLLTVTVQDLKVTLAPIGDDSEIVKVTAGNYLQTKHQINGPVTVSFGNIYSREVRRVIVDLLLPSAIKSGEILKVTYSSSSSSYSGRLQFAVPPEAMLDVWRTGITIGMEVLEEEIPKELETEEARLHLVKMIKDARMMADLKKLKDAQDKLVEAQNQLVELSDPLLKTDVHNLLELFKTLETYEAHGRSFSLALESSHDRQRFATRGIDMRLFATPRMDMYLEQANRFLREPTTLVQTADQDDMEEVAADLANMIPCTEEDTNEPQPGYISDVPSAVIKIRSLDRWTMMIELEAKNKLVVVEFTASWCRASRSIAPFFAFLANKFPDAIFLKVDIDDMEDIAEAYGVDGVPTFLFMNKGKVKDTLRGAHKEELFEKLQLQMALIMDN